MQFSSIWPIDRARSGVTTAGQSRPGSDGIPPSSSITGASTSDSLVSCQDIHWGGGYSSAEIQSVYFTTDWANVWQDLKLWQNVHFGKIMKTATHYIQGDPPPKKTEPINFFIASTKINQYNCGGACGVMVTVGGNGHGDTCSNPRRDWLHFTEH